MRIHKKFGSPIGISAPLGKLDIDEVVDKAEELLDSDREDWQFRQTDERLFIASPSIENPVDTLTPNPKPSTGNW